MRVKTLLSAIALALAGCGSLPQDTERDALLTSVEKSIGETNRECVDVCVDEIADRYEECASDDKKKALREQIVRAREELNITNPHRYTRAVIDEALKNQTERFRHTDRPLAVCLMAEADHSNVLTWETDKLDDLLPWTRFHLFEVGSGLEFAGRCNFASRQQARGIDFLVVGSHGGEGHIAFGESSLISRDISEYFLPINFSNDATIVLSGCHAGTVDKTGYSFAQLISFALPGTTVVAADGICTGLSYSMSNGKIDVDSLELRGLIPFVDISKRFRFDPETASMEELVDQKFFREFKAPPKDERGLRITRGSNDPLMDTYVTDSECARDILLASSQCEDVRSLLRAGIDVLTAQRLLERGVRVHEVTDFANTVHSRYGVNLSVAGKMAEHALSLGYDTTQLDGILQDLRAMHWIKARGYELHEFLEQAKQAGVTATMYHSYKAAGLLGEAVIKAAVYDCSPQDVAPYLDLGYSSEELSHHFAQVPILPVDVYQIMIKRGDGLSPVKKCIERHRQKTERYVKSGIDRVRQINECVAAGVAPKVMYDRMQDGMSFEEALKAGK